MDKIRALVLDELNLVEEQFCNLFEIRNDVFKDLNDFLIEKSKRIRSIICLLYLKSYGKSITSDIIKVLFALELVHNASLLHDDVVDDSGIRRGKKNLYYKYGSELSVLSGDYVLSIAVEKLLSINNKKVTDFFLTATRKMSEAEIEQLTNRRFDVDIEHYLQIIYGKTASLFCAGIKSVAILSELDIEEAENFAENFGMLFQINNDLSPESIKNDKKNSTKTAIDIIGIEKTLDLKDNYKEELSKIINNFPDNEYKKGIEDLVELL